MNKRKFDKLHNIVIKIDCELDRFGVFANAITIKETDYLHNHLKEQDWIQELYKDYVDNWTDKEIPPSSLDEYLDYYWYEIVIHFVELWLED